MTSIPLPKIPERTFFFGLIHLLDFSWLLYPLPLDLLSSLAREAKGLSAPPLSLWPFFIQED